MLKQFTSCRIPTVSVVIPAYNAESFLGQAIESALSQTYPDLDIYIVDDGSIDGTSQIIHHYLSNKRIHSIHQDTSGPAAARNRGIAEAQGEFIAFLDADDLWEPQKLAKQINLFQQNNDLGLVYSRYRTKILNATGSWEDDEERNRWVRARTHYRGQIFRELVYGPFIALPSVVIPRRVLDDVGLFDTHLITAEDRHLWARIAHDYPIGYVDEELVIVRRHGGNISWDPAREPQTLDFLRKIAEQFPECSLSKGGWMRTTYADTARTSGDDALHAGRMGQARRELWQACRYRPWRLSNWLRLALAMLPRPMLDGLRRIRHREER
jgi:glycosyltransferase involved in cell wall biosynthesis